MNAQDLEQRARELADELTAMANEPFEAGCCNANYPITAARRLMETAAAALRQQASAVECSCPHMDMNEPANNHGPSCPGRQSQQPAPVDLEQFREAVQCFRSWCKRDHGRLDHAAYEDGVEKAGRLLSIIDNAGKVDAHPDDAAVDRFAAAMKAKLADARAKGRGGWQDKDDCPQQRLSDMLRAHVEKGDPRDVANFAMFLHQRGESILPGHQPTPVDGESTGALTMGQRAVAFELLRCFESWEPNVCVLGNVCAKDAADLLRSILANQPAPVVDDAMRELIEAGELVAYERLGEGPAKRWRDMQRFRAALARAQGVQS